MQKIDNIVSRPPLRRYSLYPLEVFAKRLRGSQKPTRLALRCPLDRLLEFNRNFDSQLDGFVGHLNFASRQAYAATATLYYITPRMRS